MKKIVLIILTLLYAVVSSGITLNLHYCMGRLTGVEWGSASVCASCGQKKMASHCCSNETQYVKLALDQDVSQATVTSLSPAVVELMPVFQTGLGEMLPEDILQPSAVFDSPPGQTGVPLFVHHCTFLI